MKLFGTMKVNNMGNLQIGGCDTVELVEKFATPLYVVDEELVRTNCRTFRNNFSLEGINTEVIYASKAFLNLAMCKLIEEEGLMLDVVSGGELYIALEANFPSSRIYMHGNNKTIDELRMAIEAEVGRIIVDNRQELELLEHLCETLDKEVDILLRINPGIDAHTHEYIQTSKNDSKFGESIFSEDINIIINRLKNSNKINLKGFHCHIGSQIFEEESFYKEALVMLDFINRVKKECDFITEELNLGGGFGVYYSHHSEEIDLKKCLKNMLLIMQEETNQMGLNIPKVMIEPGRSIIANAGTTLYKIGGTKKTYGGKQYIFVDGGMTDNPRTALYGAKYEAVIANKMDSEKKEVYTIAGKCCESGDVLIKEIKLPQGERNDILAVLSTGAYNYSMSSNYNKILRPAVIFVKNGLSRLVVQRETYKDLIRNDVL